METKSPNPRISKSKTRKKMRNYIQLPHSIATEQHRDGEKEQLIYKTRETSSVRADGDERETSESGEG
jgi:hypothetical protein